MSLIHIGWNCANNIGYSRIKHNKQLSLYNDILGSCVINNIFTQTKLL